jgi:hypothetical protein
MGHPPLKNKTFLKAANASTMPALQAAETGARSAFQAALRIFGCNSDEPKAGAKHHWWQSGTKGDKKESKVGDKK